MNRDDRKDSIAAMHRDNIITAAEQLFVENGFDKTTVDDISKQAQYSKRTVYIYFKSKEEIYSHVTLKGYSLLIQSLHISIDTNEDFIPRYFSMCNALATFYKEHSVYFSGIVTSQNKDFDSLDDSEISKKIYDAGNDLNHVIETFLKEGQDEGIILRNIDLKKTILFFWSSLISIIMLSNKKPVYIKNNTGTSADEFMEFGFKLLLNSILEV